MGVILSQLIVSFGLLLLSRLLIKPPKDASSGLGEDKPTTLATRGEYVPMIFGKRRVGYLFGWAGDRKVKKEGGGGKGGTGGQSTKVWFESGWHQLGIGPASKLYAIYANGEVIWEGPIDAATSPSGTTIDAGSEGSFTIYWGESNQPLNTFLGASKRMAITSRWPSLCYIIWQNKRLGSSPTWPQIEYVIEFGCSDMSLRDSSFQIIDTDSNEGINPAYILVQLLAAKYPHGVGIDGEYIDRTTLEALGALAETEEVPMNLLVEGGNECAKTVQVILQDMGVLLPQVGSRLAFISNREPSGLVPVLGDDVIAPPDLERTIQHGDTDLSRPVFTYKDSTDDKYRDSDIAFDDDAEASELGRLSSQRIRIDTVTDMLPASKIARRRSQESTIKSNVKVKALRGARQLVAGQVFDHADLGRLRITSSRRSDDSPLTELDCSLDTYGVPDIADIGDGGVASVAGLDVVKDIAFTYLELPTELSSEIQIVVLRIRGHEQVEGAFIHASADATTYTNIGTQDTPSTGGLLETALAITAEDLVATGPIFEADNADAAEILDLTADAASWQSGRQIAVINDEVFYLESVTVQSETAWAATTAYSLDDVRVPTSSTGLRYICTTAGTSGSTEPTWPSEAGDTVNDSTVVWTAHHFAYQLNNLIRAKLSTTKAAHSISDQVFIADFLTIKKLAAPIISAGEDICIKTQPFTPSQTVDIATVTAVCKTIIGTVVGAPDFITISDAGQPLDGNYITTNTGLKIEAPNV